MPSDPDSSMTGPADGATQGSDATPAALFWGLVAAAVALDQITKLVTFAAVGYDQYRVAGPAVIPGFFYLTPRYNPYMAWGLGKSLVRLHPSLLAVVKVAIAGVVIYLREKTAVSSGRRLFDASMGLILAGAVGNIIDRLHSPHAVMDFFDFWLGTPGEKTWHYPTFNVADIYIVAGVAMYIYWAWRIDLKKTAPE